MRGGGANLGHENDQSNETGSEQELYSNYSQNDQRLLQLKLAFRTIRLLCWLLQKGARSVGRSVRRSVACLTGRREEMKENKETRTTG